MLHAGSFSFVETYPCKQEGSICFRQKDHNVLCKAIRWHANARFAHHAAHISEGALFSAWSCPRDHKVYTDTCTCHYICSDHAKIYMSPVAADNCLTKSKVTRWSRTFHFLFLNPGALLPEARLSPGSPPTPLPQTRPPRRRSCWANVLAVPDQLHIHCIPQRKHVPQQQFQRGLPQPQPDQAWQCWMSRECVV